VSSAYFSIPVLLILLFLPGYSLLPEKISPRLRFPFVLNISVALTSVFGLMLVGFGCFSSGLLLLLELPLLLFRLRRRKNPGIALKAHIPALLIFGLLAIFALMRPSEIFDADGDAGVYTISARHLYETGHWTWEMEDVASGLPVEQLSYRRNYVHSWQEVAPGFILKSGRISPQFFPLFPMWGALFIGVFPSGGISGLLGASLLGVLMFLVSMGLLIRVLFGRMTSFLFLVLLVLNPVFLIFLRYPSAEIFLGGILGAFLLSMYLYLARPGRCSAAIPASLLALALLTKFFAWAVMGVLAVFLFMLPSRYRKSSLSFALFLLPAIIAAAFFSGPHLANHFGELMLLDAFKVLAAGAFSLFLLRFIWGRIETRAPFAFVLVFCGFLIFLWIRGISDPSGPGKLIHDFFKLNGWLLLPAGSLGLLLSSWTRRKKIHLLLTLFFVGLGSYLFLGSGDSAFYPFAARRFVVLSIPLAAFFAAFFFSWIARRFRSLALGRISALALVLLTVLPPFLMQREVLVLRQGMGFNKTLDQLEKAIPSGVLVLATPQVWKYAAHLLLNRGLQVFCVDQKNAAQWGSLPSLLEKVCRPTFLLDSGRKGEGLPIADEDRLLIAETISPPLKVRRSRHVYHLREINRESFAPESKLDIGGEDGLLVSGFYGKESGGGRSYRWTSRRVRIRMAGGRYLRFLWNPGKNPEKPLRVGVWADGQRVGFAKIKPGWNWSRWFLLPVEGAEHRIELRVHTFRPAEIGRGHDRRSLGLMLDRVEVGK